MHERFLRVYFKYSLIVLHGVLVGRPREARKVVIYLLKKHTAMTNRAIGEQFGSLSYSTVTQVCRRLQEEVGQSRRLRTSVGRIEKEMSHVKG